MKDKVFCENCTYLKIFRYYVDSYRCTHPDNMEVKYNALHSYTISPSIKVVNKDNNCKLKVEKRKKFLGVFW